MDVEFAFFPNIVSPQHMKVRMKKSKTDPIQVNFNYHHRQFSIQRLCRGRHKRFPPPNTRLLPAKPHVPV